MASPFLRVTPHRGTETANVRLPTVGDGSKETLISWSAPRRPSTYEYERTKCTTHMCAYASE